MCGIIAVLHRRRTRAVPEVTEVLAHLGRAEELLQRVIGVAHGSADLAEAAHQLTTADELLRGPVGVRAILENPGMDLAVVAATDRISTRVAELESDLDATAPSLSAADLEAASASLIAVKDPLWSVSRDRLRIAEGVTDLGGAHLGSAAVDGYWAIVVALSAIDRMEVRGRDSAGLHVTVHDHGLDLDSPELVAELHARRGGAAFGNGSVERAGDSLAFAYKFAAEIGELGDNTAALRTTIRDDALLRRALVADTAEVTVTGHTRWASVGIISEPNAHPVNQVEIDGSSRPYVAASLNGDVDNYADLKVTNRLALPDEVTTDAKVIPTLVARNLDDGMEPAQAFREAVARFEGSVAIAADVAAARDTVTLALRGSGQGLFVGLTEGAYVVASEPYGVVEECSRYLRLDGETPADPERPESRGQIVALQRQGAGTLDGVTRVAYDGTQLPVSEDELVVSEVTTRDIDRGDAPHFLLKELGEAPTSFRTTLRGRLAGLDGPSPSVVLDESVLPLDVRRRVRDGDIDRVVVIGQGTAAVAGQSLARLVQVLAADTPLSAVATPATELSGFGLTDDMSRTLVVAISQSGTTTDTNRTVDLVRARGAAVVAIVNRRGSDLVDRADGVLYTSDGRDVEMSVASTKAFYSQVAAGALLASALAVEAGADPAAHGDLLRGLAALPDALLRVLGTRAAIRDAATRHAPAHRYWAIVGNGANRIAANELRIKLSELCYKAIASDATEDKKHIDLSSEPLILVCTAGLYGSNADDVAKEVAIFRAHKATPIVIANEGEARFSGAVELLSVPAVHPDLDFVLSSMVGHLFGYEAALAIDASARPLRELRQELEGAVARGVRADRLLAELRPELERHAAAFVDGLRTHRYDGHLEASTAVRLAGVLRYATGLSPFEAYELEMGKIGTPAAVVEDLVAALGQAIDELTRPVDAIKHQAKTVTVGISRSDETFLQTPLVKALLEAGTPRDRLTYANLRMLVGLDGAVAEVLGWTRYRIDGDPRTEDARISAIDRGGIARDIPSRTSSDPVLRGTKRRAAAERVVWAAVGRSDSRQVLHVPEVKGAQTTGLTLVHVRFHDRLPAAAARNVLESFKDRYGALRDIVTETEPSFRDDVLARVPVVDLLTEPVVELATHWTS